MLVAGHLTFSVYSSSESDSYFLWIAAASLGYAIETIR